MGTFFSIIYNSILKNADPDSAIAMWRASILLAFCQTCNLFSLVFLLTMVNLISLNGKIDEVYLGIVGLTFTLINAFFLKRKNSISRRGSIVSLIYFVLSPSIFSILMMISKGG